MHNSKVAEITSVFALRQCSALYRQDLPNSVSLFLMTSIQSIRNTQLNTGNLELKSRLAPFQKHLFRNLCECHSHGQICDLSSARASKFDLRSSLLQPSSCWRTPAFAGWIFSFRRGGRASNHTSRNSALPVCQRSASPANSQLILLNRCSK